MRTSNLRGTLKTLRHGTHRWFRQNYARARLRLLWTQYRLVVWTARRRTIITFFVILALAGASINLLPLLQAVTAPYFSEPVQLSYLSSLLQAVGAALVGATTIAFSFVMFAMQVNVERMPHGLFFKFSSDRRILAFFAGTFLLAISIACSSLFIRQSSEVGLVFLAGFWAIAAILVLVFSAFRRALFLVNPLKQLEIVITDAQNEFKTAARRAAITRPLLEVPQPGVPKADNSLETEHDTSRAAYFQLNPHWTLGPKRAIDHCVSFAHRYAEQGDYQVASNALLAVVEINASYVDTKGRTFFASNPLFDTPLATDDFINETLEHLRRTVRVALARGDERQVEQVFVALTKLVQVYVNIDYGQSYASKTHALLAAGYLAGAVESVVPHQMPDVLMEGVRFMGRSAAEFVVKGQPDEILSLVEKITFISGLGSAKKEYQPVTVTGVEQLSELTIRLLQSKTNDPSFTLRVLREKIASVAVSYLQFPDTPLLSNHSLCLASYFSPTSTGGCLQWFTELVNQLASVEAENEKAQQIIHNIESWADGLYQTQKTLVLLAVERRSQFSFDMIHWITHVSKLLLFVSESPACDVRTKAVLQRHASWLLFTLSWIPDDRETVVFVENYRMTEALFEVAMEAQQRGFLDFSADTGRELLLRWAFKAGKHQTGRGILERALFGLVTLALMNDPHEEEVEYLKRKLADYLAGPDAPEREIRVWAGRKIRERAVARHGQGHWSSGIDVAMNRLDQETLRPVLEDIANTLMAAPCV